MNGMDVDEEGDTFFDDDFPDIAEEELQQLEQNAITFTQQKNATSASRVVETNAPNHPSLQHSIRAAAPSNHQKSGAIAPHRHQLQHVQHASEEADDVNFDENSLPLVEEERPAARPSKVLDEVTLREQWRKNRFGQPGPQAVPKSQASMSRPAIPPPQQPTQFQAYPGVVRQIPVSHHDSFSTITSANIEEDTLRVKLEELTASLVKTQDELLARKGEIQIIRAKQAEGDKVHLRELETLRKVKNDDAQKHRLAIEALNAEKAKTMSDIQFMKKELGDESRKVHSLQRQLKERPLRDRPTNVETTPKKNASSLRDGFDEDDMMNASPVKSGRRSQKGTPTANRKRKHAAGNEVNIQPLPLRPSFGTEETRTSIDSKPHAEEVAAAVVRKDLQTERHLRIVQRVLVFRPSGSRETIIERLMQVKFPNDQSQTLGSMILLSAAKLHGPRLPGDLLQVFTGLWARCLKEKYYVCLGLLIEVINFILDIDMLVVDAKVISELLPIIQSTATMNATVRFRLLVKKDWLDKPDEPKPECEKSINTTACLDLLFTLACLVTDDADLIGNFWGLMSTDFVLMMLNACQPVEDVTLMLQLLATSILPQTFGNVCAIDEQKRMEVYIVDRICYLLWELPKVLDTERAVAKHIVCKLRLEAIDLLSKLTLGSSLNPFDPSSATRHGTVLLADHPTAIARLVRSIYEETSTMYLVTPSQALHADLVNNAVRVLYFILNSPAGRQVDLQYKLAGTNGGAHKYRVVLTRLAFAEGIYIDRGIIHDTVRMATELLEESVTPDEANELTAAFGGSMGRSGSTQQ